MLTITAGSLKHGEQLVSIDQVPDACPICHLAIVPKHLMARLAGPPLGRLQVVYQCSSDRCQGTFIALHDHFPTSQANNNYRLMKTWPRTPRKMRFSEEIENVSPTFVTIYNQALEAEAASLDQLTGIGLRKALEFLVKDFAISGHKDDEERIRQLALSKVIEAYLEDANLKSVAKRATWLGNDESHYTRKWTEHDIEDLKRLVRLTVNWVENVIVTKQYVEDMNPQAAAGGSEIEAK